jgi:hypothetical protein
LLAQYTSHKLQRRLLTFDLGLVRFLGRFGTSVCRPVRGGGGRGDATTLDLAPRIVGRWHIGHGLRGGREREGSENTDNHMQESTSSIEKWVEICDIEIQRLIGIHMVGVKIYFFLEEFLSIGF